MSSLGARLRSIDVYRRLPKDLSETSSVGGIATLLLIIFVSYLFLTELIAYLSVKTITSMSIDNDTSDIIDSHPTLQININVTLFRMPCAIASVDVEDIMGGHAVDVGGRLHKFRTDQNGNRKFDENGLSLLGDIGGPHIDMIDEGCNIAGTMIVKRVPGNFHISSHPHTDLLGDMFPGGHQQNISHKIHYLYFGELDKDHLKNIDNAAMDPLMGIHQTAELTGSDEDPRIHSVSYEYFLRIVPTTFISTSGRARKTYQYVVNWAKTTQEFRLSSAYFRFDINPIRIEFKQVQAENFGHFLVQICAIIGGIFTVLGLLSSLMIETHKRIKQHLGKQT